MSLLIDCAKRVLLRTMNAIYFVVFFLCARWILCPYFQRILTLRLWSFSMVICSLNLIMTVPFFTLADRETLFEPTFAVTASACAFER